MTADGWGNESISLTVEHQDDPSGPAVSEITLGEKLKLTASAVGLDVGESVTISILDGTNTIVSGASNPLVRENHSPTAGVHQFKATGTFSKAGQTDSLKSSAVKTVTVVELKNFNAKADRFPKCRGESIGREDFFIQTEPAGREAMVEVWGLDTDPTGTGVIALTATATTKGGQSKTAEYIVLGDETTEKCQTIHARPINETFTGAIVPYTTDADIINNAQNEVGTSFYHEYSRNGTIVGTSVPAKWDESTWGDCGGTVSRTDTVSYTIGGSVNATWTAIEKVLGVGGGFSFSYTSTKSVTFGHGTIANKQLRQEAWKQPITLTVSGTNSSSRACIYTPFVGASSGGWVVDGSTFTEQEIGELPAEMALCVKCCHL